MTATTNGTHAATVQTLTAEVRVLQVGSRQVTLSVYRQLDHRPYADITPMGRVRATRNPDDPNEIEVVGRAADGQLVGATLIPPCWYTAAPQEFLHAQAHASWATRLGAEPEPCYSRADTWSTPLEGSRLRWHIDQRSKHDACNADFRRPWSSQEHQERWLGGQLCRHGDMESLRSAWVGIARRQDAALSQRQATYEEAERLPLIVLAGLK